MTHPISFTVAMETMDLGGLHEISGAIDERLNVINEMNFFFFFLYLFGKRTLDFLKLAGKEKKSENIAPVDYKRKGGSWDSSSRRKQNERESN